MLDVLPDHPINSRIFGHNLVPLYLSFPQEPVLSLFRRFQQSLFPHDYLAISLRVSFRV
ncbi:MAG TPA: hypothetical protein VFS69_04835 [Sphingomicrobium sp.]|nr:hypothetical protein [Sphingomicrobium sp.]